MTNAECDEHQKVKAVLVYDEGDGSHAYELQGLVDTLGLHTVATLCVSVKSPQPRFVLGSGKAEQVIGVAGDSEADCIVFDFRISPTQQRNWEREANIPVYDREEIILRIFASRAQTKEAVLQVELARLQYSLPRLAHSYGDMARQRGGNYGSRGSGETQLELDRRAVLKKIAYIKTRLHKVGQERIVQGKRRSKTGAFTCAIVGYTNAGKSTLLNTLTGASAYTEDALFATLDPTTRRLNLNSNLEILLTDTVGFIRNLPHTLVTSFYSTLEQARQADLILLVLDACDVHFESHYQTTLDVLNEIGAESVPKVLVFNKIDSLDCNLFLKNRIDSYAEQYGAIKVSAKSGKGFDELTHGIVRRLVGEAKTYKLPLALADIGAMRKAGVIHSQKWLDDGVIIVASLNAHTASDYADYIV